MKKNEMMEANIIKLLYCKKFKFFRSLLVLKAKKDEKSLSFVYKFTYSIVNQQNTRDLKFVIAIVANAC